MKNVKPLVTICLLVVLSGCTLSASKQFLKQTDRTSSATSFFHHFDRSIDREKVNNRSVTRVEGFPYLAGNRFLAAVKPRIQEEEAFAAWVRQMALLSLQSRHAEIRNLSRDAVQQFYTETGLIEAPTRDALWKGVEKYALQMKQSDQSGEGYRKALMEAVQVPDDYSMTLRVLGVYPLVAWPLAYVSDGFFDTLRDWQKMSPDQHKVLGELITYRLQREGMIPPDEISRRFEGLTKDELGLPVLNKAIKQDLVRSYAPVIIQDSVDHYDRIGEVSWKGESLAVNGENPVAYYFFSNAFFRGEPIWQITYVFWYSGRLGDNAPWFERGLIDGVTIRISLDSRGEPFMIDLMNNCGCSHQFFPRQQLVAGIRERSMMFDALVPAWMPGTYPDRPVRFRINSGWHQVQHIGTEPVTGKSRSYKLRPYSELESLPLAGELRRSMFNADGIVPGSERVEPYFMFSAGITEIGAMRQRGHHPIALIGRSHFDDPYLFDLHFNWN